MLHIETGHRVTADVKVIDSDRVRFVTEDGRCMFEVAICKDGRSLEVRGVEATKFDGKIYASSLVVRPRVSNVVTIHTPLYDED